MKFLSRLDDFEHIVIDGSVSGTGLSSLYLKDTATPILRIGNNTGDSFITYDGSELSISSDVDLRLTTPTDQDVFLITSSGNITTTQAGGTFTIGGGLTLEAITGGFLKTDANGVVSVDNSSYLTNETDTLDSVTDRGNTTTNAITVGGITVGDSHFIGNETTYDNLIIISSSGENINLAAANGIHFNTNAVSPSNVGNNRMYLSNAGNLGIGTTAPIGRIDIRSNYGRWRVNGYGGMYFRNDSDTGYTRYIHPRSDGSLSFGRIADANLSGSDPDKFAASSYDQFYLDSSGTAFFNGGINFAGVNGANFVVDTDGQRIVWEHQRNGIRRMTFYHETDADTFNFNFESGNKLQINGNRIVTVNELGTASASAATDFVAVTGDTMTGKLTIDRSTTNDPALTLNSSSSGWGSGMRFKNTTATTGKEFGIYSSATGYLQFTKESDSYGTIMRFTPNNDFEIAADNLFYTGSGSVGIGTTAPSSILHISASSPILTISNTDTSIVDEQVIGQIDFKSLDASTNMTAVFGSIRTEAEGALDNGVNDGGKMVFSTFKQSTSLVDQMSIDRDGALRLHAYGEGLLQTDANGNVSLDTSTYLTSYTETQTLDDVTTLGATTTNAITVGEITGQKAVDGDVNFIFKNTSTGTSSAGNVWIQAEAYSTIRFAKVSTGSQRGKITYDFANEAMSFRTNGVDNRLYINSSGNVGIGLTNPQRPLHVNGIMQWGGGSSAPYAYSGIDTGGLYFEQVDDNSGKGKIRIQTRTNNTGSYTSLSIDADNSKFVFANGNVGIGTTDPTTLLELKSTTVTAGLCITSANNAYSDINLGDVDDVNIQRIRSEHSSNSLLIYTNNSEQMRINSSGNVGIGTTNPSYKLDVAGSLNINANATNGIRFEDDGAFTTLNADAVLRVNQRVEVWGGGSGKQYLDVRDQSGTVKVMLNAEDNSYFASNNVGIGTTSPNEKLHVESDGDGHIAEFKGSGTNAGGRNIRIGVGNTDLPELPTYQPYIYASASDSANNSLAIVSKGGSSSTGGIDFYTGTNSAGTTKRMRIDRSGGLQLYAYGAGLLQTDASGNVSVDTSTYLTSYTETQTLDDVTTLGSATDNSISVGGLEIFQDLSAAETIDYPLVISSKDDNNGINQLGGEGVGIKFRIAGNDATDPGNSLVGASIAAIRKSSSDTESDTHLAFFTSQNDEVLDEAMRITSDGNVGIGTTSPTPKLHLVYSGGTYSTDATSGFINQADTGRATMRLRSITDNPSELFFDIDGGIRWDISARGSSQDHSLNFYPAAANPGYALVSAHTFQLSQNGDVIVTGSGTSGKLGVRTTNPTSHLDVVGNARIGIDSEHAFQVTDDSTNNFLVLSSTQRTTASAARDIKFRSYGTDATDNVLVMDMSAGNVGIGTDSPVTGLDVRTSTYSNTTARFGDSRPVYIVNNDPIIGFNAYYDNGWKHGTSGHAAYIGTSGSSGHIYFYTGDGTSRAANANMVANERMRIQTNGNVGIGTTNPTTRLYVDGGESTFNRGNSDGAIARFRGKNNEKASIGTLESYFISDVAIGHDSPETNLHVVGTAETRLRVGSSNASSNVVLELRDENTPTGQGTVITYNNSTGETYFNNALSTATTDFHFQSGEYGTANDFFTLSNSGGNAILHLKTTSGDSFITYEDSINELAVASDGDLRLTTPTDQDVFFISSGGNIDMTQAGGTVDMGGNLIVDGEVGIGTSSPDHNLHVVSSAQCPALFESTTAGGGIALMDSTTTNDAQVGIGAFGNDLCFRSGGAAAGNMRLLANGNFGIGTTSPTTKLQVVGDVEIGDVNTFSANLRMLGNTAINYDGQGGSFAFANYSMYLDNNLQVMDLFSSTMRVTNGNVGIGTTAPQQALHIKGATNALMMLEGDNDNGIAGCYYKTEDTDNTMNRTKGFFGWQGQTAYGNGYFTMWLDAAEDNGAVTSSEEKFRWERDGDFHADGDVIAYSTTTPSDIRLKTDIETIESASEKVSKLRGVEYTWSKGKLAGQREIGLIAQEVEAVVPEVVKEKELPLWDNSGESYKTVDYEKLVALLIESNKELQARVEQLENKLDGITK